MIQLQCLDGPPSRRKESSVGTVERNSRSFEIPFQTRKQLTVWTPFVYGPDAAQRTPILSRIRFSEAYK
jgi:hypothetical protein